MNKNILIVLLLTLSLIFMSACKREENPIIEKKYTVTWKNYDETVLEIDNDVLKGTFPTYNGAVPVKLGNDEATYLFVGWSPTISEVVSDVTYVAQFIKSINKYQVIWKNYDGTILETDNDVAYGTIPEYNGPVPIKTGNEDVTYTFKGWSPVVTSVTSNIVYTATYSEKHTGDDIPGIDPVISEDSSTIQYGFYPQTHVNNVNLINKLNDLTETNINGWYLYEGIYYTKIVAKTFNNEKYTFDDGTEIINGHEYWFVCEPITWNILKNSDNTYYLLSKMLLDNQSFYNNYDERVIDGNKVYANNYENSDLRRWLNNEFYNIAFNLNNTYLNNTSIDNSGKTTDDLNNQYANKNTIDKVYLPSYKDYLNSEYGFETNSANTSKTREAKTTDYARANGAWSNTTNGPLKYNGSYWTRSATSEYSYAVWNVNSGGYLSTYAVDGSSHSVRPSISISI